MMPHTTLLCSLAHPTIIVSATNLMDIEPLVYTVVIGHLQHAFDWYHNPLGQH